MKTRQSLKSEIMRGRKDRKRLAIVEQDLENTIVEIRSLLLSTQENRKETVSKTMFDS
jgi:hypothetical protein